MFLRSMLLGAALGGADHRACLRAGPTEARPAQALLRRGAGEPARARRHQRARVHPAARTSTSTSTRSMQPNSPRALLDGDVSGLAAGAVRGVRRARVHAAADRAGRAHEHGLDGLAGDAVLGRAGAEVGQDRRAGALPRARVHDARQPVYAHYVFGGKSLRTIKLGMPKGPCGTFNVKRKQFPFKKRPRVGTWTIQFDQLSYYDPNATREGPDDDQGQADDQAETGSGSLTAAGGEAQARRRRRRPRCGRRPANSPLSRPSASGSTSVLGDHALERPGAVRRVVAEVAEQVAGARR